MINPIIRRALIVLSFPIWGPVYGLGFLLAVIGYGLWCIFTEPLGAVYSYIRYGKADEERWDAGTRWNRWMNGKKP